MSGFPWHTHRTQAEVIESERLRAKRLPQLSREEWLRLQDLMRKQREANPGNPP